MTDLAGQFDFQLSRRPVTRSLPGGFPPETKMLRSEDQQKDIAEFGLQLAEVFSRRSPFIADLLKGAEFRPATISFAREHTVDLGGVTVKVLAMGANHTRGDTVFLVEPDNVLFPATW